MARREACARVSPSHPQILDVLEVTVATPRFQELRESCLGHVESSFARAHEYVIATFEVRGGRVMRQNASSSVRRQVPAEGLERQTSSLATPPLPGGAYSGLNDRPGRSCQEGGTRNERTTHGSLAVLQPQDKRVLEQFRLTWNAGAYEAGAPDLSAMRRDLLQQRRWGRQVTRAWGRMG